METLEDISLQKKAEKALRESEMRYKILTDITIEGIIIHSKGIIKDINPSIPKITGYTSDQLIGKSIFQLLHSDSHPAMDLLLK